MGSDCSNHGYGDGRGRQVRLSWSGKFIVTKLWLKATLYLQGVADYHSGELF
jgi:hypothetical protein